MKEEPIQPIGVGNSPGKRPEKDDVYYKTWVDEGHFGTDKWVVTVIKGGVVYLWRETEWTRPGGTWNAKRLDTYDRTSFPLHAGPPEGWARSESAALAKALPAINEAIHRLEKLRASITGQRTKKINKRKKIKRVESRKENT